MGNFGYLFERVLAKRAGCSRSERVAREASGHERGLLAKRAGCSRSERCEQVYLCKLRAGLFTHDNSNSNNNSSSSNDNSISNNKNNRKQLFTFVSHLSNRLLSFYNFLRIHLSSHDFIAKSQSDRNWLVQCMRVYPSDFRGSVARATRRPIGGRRGLEVSMDGSHPEGFHGV